MRRLLALALLAAALGCESVRTYPNSDEELAPAFLAKEMCSCLFVMNQPEPYCQIWSHQDPALATYQVDRPATVVQASAGMFWGARARYQGAHFGCTLE